MGPGDVVELSCVTLFRDQTLILRDINWQVDRGQHWAVIGANGSGKTTLLNIAAGYMWPSRGTARVLGSSFGSVDLRELRKRIGWVSSALMERIPPRRTARQIAVSGRNATLGLLKDDPTDEDLQRADSLLDFLGCAHRAGHAFGTLSQGEQQKTLIARALMPHPELLILDEVSSGLDLASRENLLRTLGSLAEQKDGPTLIFVTHHIEEIIPIFTHVLALKDGKVLACGPKDEVLTQGILEEALELELQVDRASGRYWPTIRTQ